MLVTIGWSNSDINIVLFFGDTILIPFSFFCDRLLSCFKYFFIFYNYNFNDVYNTASLGQLNVIKNNIKLLNFNILV